MFFGYDSSAKKRVTQAYFVRAYCSRCDKPFLIRLDRSADDILVMTYGVKDGDPEGLAYGEGNGVDQEVDFSNSRRGPQYKCPWCGNTEIVKCGNCHEITCWEDNNLNFHCIRCGISDTISGHITSVKGDSGSAQ
jgi:predicted RNA-binding Zn-ribbon protein involved in translation (DUF1610 family)